MSYISSALRVKLPAALTPAWRVNHHQVNQRFVPRLSPVNERALDRISRIPIDFSGQSATALRRVSDDLLPSLSAHARELSSRGKAINAVDSYNQHLASTLVTVCTWVPITLDRFDTGTCLGAGLKFEASVAQSLKDDSRESFAVLCREDPQRAMVYAACVDPGLRASFGITLTPAQLKVVDLLASAANHTFLDQPSVLVLRDYVHPASGSFNSLRATRVLAQWLGSDFAKHLQAYELQFSSALHALGRMPHGRVHVGSLYKGLSLSHYHERVLDHKYQHDLPLTIDWPTSVTSSAEQSYLGRCVGGHHYAHEITYQGKARAVCVANFHAAESLAQSEALLMPGQAFNWTGRSTDYLVSPEGGGEEVTRYTVTLASGRDDE